MCQGADAKHNKEASAMAQRSKAISDDLYEQARKSLKEAGREGEAGRRLQAIISAKI